jgi:hypothetical protein
LVNLLILGGDHRWIDIWNGDPAGRLGMKQQTIGRPIDPFGGESSIRRNQLEAYTPLTRRVLASVVDHMAGHFELLHRDATLLLEEDDVPVLVTHDGC